MQPVCSHDHIHLRTVIEVSEAAGRQAASQTAGGRESGIFPSPAGAGSGGGPRFA